MRKPENLYDALNNLVMLFSRQEEEALNSPEGRQHLKEEALQEVINALQAEIERICRKYDVLLVADEVICGFGRTGEWFASQYYDFRPDVMTLAKGITSGYIPLGAVMFNDRISRVLSEKGGELAHGYTYSGHPVCTAVALENIRILQEEKIVERAKTEVAPYLAQRWAELGEHRLVGEARIAGMVGALELVPKKPSPSWKVSTPPLPSTLNHCPFASCERLSPASPTSDFGNS